jgi:formate hydrogenlyase transcriptional activator
VDHSQGAQPVNDNLHPSGDRARLLLEINNAIVSHLDLPKLFSAVSSCLRREIAHEFEALGLYDADVGALRLHALDFPERSDAVELGTIIPLEGTIGGLVFNSGRPVLRRLLDFQEFPTELFTEARRMKSCCAVPLNAHGRTLGVLGVASVRESAFTEDDCELLAQIARQVAIAVDNSLNFREVRVAREQMKRDRDRMELLLKVNNALVSLDDNAAGFRVTARQHHIPPAFINS